MCGRFAFYSPREAVAEVFGVDFGEELEPRYNIAPTQAVAALRSDGQGGLQPVRLRWGLIPFWADDESIGNRLINARAETVAEKPAFRAAFRRRRCGLLADGFYEWRREGDRKQPYFITRRDGRPFALAGLWERWEGEAGPVESCTIVTTDANADVARLHARMPVVLTAAQLRSWVQEQAPDRLQDLLGPAVEGLLRHWPVSRRVNRPANDEASLIESVERDA